MMLGNLHLAGKSTLTTIMSSIVKACLAHTFRLLTHCCRGWIAADGQQPEATEVQLPPESDGVQSDSDGK